MNFGKLINGLTDKINSGITTIKEQATKISDQTFGINKKIQIQNIVVIQEKLISEGGYGFIWRVREEQTGKRMALKKILCQNPESLQVAKQELAILKSLPKHGNLLEFYGGEIKREENNNVAYILMEFCEGGSLFDLMEKLQKDKLSEKQILFIIKEICWGLVALHTMNPPITHRDIKIENVLLHNKKFKLCDYGSCTTDTVDFSAIPRAEFHKYEEQFEKYTTLMYRPPEMCDVFQGYIVDTKVDTWMLGCVLFTLCFYYHPFQECSKLAIVNGQYFLPPQKIYSQKLIDLIYLMLTPNPKLRPHSIELMQIIEEFNSLQQIQLNEQAQKIKKRNEKEYNEIGNQKSSRGSDFEISNEELNKIKESIQKDQTSNQYFQEFGKTHKKQNQQNNFNKNENEILFQQQNNLQQQNKQTDTKIYAQENWVPHHDLTEEEFYNYFGKPNKS